MRETVETLRGPVATGSLGRVLMHEHVFLMNMEYTWNYRRDFFTEKTIADAAARLDAVKAAGFDSVLDLTVLGIGRHIESLAAVAERTAVNIIVSTGVYTFNELPMPFQFHGPGLMRHTEIDPMIDLFVRDLTVGIGSTTLKAGELKCAIDEPGLLPGVERVMRAIAQTHRITGAPITVHTSPHNHGGQIVQTLMAEEGVSGEALVIGHCGDTTDVDYLMALADKGSILGMDRFGLDFAITFDERVNTIVELCKRGYAGSMVLSHDCTSWSDILSPDDDKAALLPQHHWLHIHDDVIPALRERGVSDADIDTMFVANPRRHFEGAG